MPRGKVTPHGYKVNLREVYISGSNKCVADLFEMLVRERFIDGDIIVAIAEMGRFIRFPAGARRAGYRMHMDLVRQQVFCSQRQ